jgi:hypothetical protein
MLEGRGYGPESESVIIADGTVQEKGYYLAKSKYV